MRRNFQPEIVLWMPLHQRVSRINIIEIRAAFLLHSGRLQTWGEIAAMAPTPEYLIMTFQKQLCSDKIVRIQLSKSSALSCAINNYDDNKTWWQAAHKRRVEERNISHARNHPMATF